MKNSCPCPSTRVVIFSEDRLFRDGLVKLLAECESAESQISLAGVSDRWEEIIALKEKASIDVALLDYKLFNRDDLPPLSTLSSGACPVKAIWIGVPDHERDIIPCLESGAAGYIPTDASVDDLVHIVTAVANGNAWCSDRFAAFLFSRIRDFSNEKWPNGREDALLTAREFEVIELLAEGLSNKEIAGRLNIETQTVKNHVHHLLEKLSVHKRMDAVAYARQRHWLRR